MTTTTTTPDPTRTPAAGSSRLARFLLLLLLAVVPAACGDDDPTGPPEGADTKVVETGVIVNSIDLTLTLFPVDSATSTRTVELGPDGSPVGVATRGGTAVVPMGTVPAARVVDLASGEVLRTASLPEGSGATGVAFANDSIAVVANPNLNTVSPVNVRSGTAGEQIQVGTFPQAVVAFEGRIFVINARLGPDFQPEGPGTITVLSSSLAVVDSVTLSGENPTGGAFGSDGMLYVVNSGRFGKASGSLSVVDPGRLEEVEHHDGFGEFPGSPTYGPDGRLYVPSFSFGTAIWDPDFDAFIRGPDNAVAPAGVPSTPAVGFDAAGRLYATSPTCSEPTVAYRMTASFEVDVEIPAGTCPVDIAFTAVER